MKIYLLSEYEEHGSEKMVGTIDKSKVVKLAKENFDYLKEQDIYRLNELLLEDKPSKNPSNICNGWGGVQLHIIKI